VSDEELFEQWRAKRAAVQRELGGAKPDSEELAANRVAGLAAAMIRGLPDERSQSMARERWIATIRAKVDDPLLKVAPCVKVAAAIVAGTLKPIVVQEILAELAEHRRRGTLKKSPGAYFVGSAQRAFQRAGIPWEKPKPK
jgi:hypothetical protein